MRPKVVPTGIDITNYNTGKSHHGIRTHDLLHASPALSPLHYVANGEIRYTHNPTFGHTFFWSQIQYADVSNYYHLYGGRYVDLQSNPYYFYMQVSGTKWLIENRENESDYAS